jgi:hypothetical protein
MLAVVSPALAQPGPYLAEVTAESVPVRAGPADQFPETGALYRGGRVIVVHEEGEHWVAIQPPRGQVSWIRSVHLGPAEGQDSAALPRNAVVHAEPEAELTVGKPGHGRPLDIRRTRVPDRTILLVIGNKVEHNGVWWYPVEPPDGDVRYVPRSALKLVRMQPAQSVVVRSPTPAEPGKGGSEVVPASVPNRPAKPDGWPTHPLWQQAEQASRDGDLARAEQLYLRLAAEMNQVGGDAELANLCYTRVHAVREKQRQAVRGGPSPDRRVVGSSDPAAGKWVGPGGLRLAGFRYDNRATYALVDFRGQLRCYVVAGPGVELDRFRGSDVELFGTTTYPGELRGVGVLTATRVQAVRER